MPQNAHGAFTAHRKAMPSDLRSVPARRARFRKTKNKEEARRHPKALQNAHGLPTRILKYLSKPKSD
eukprot:5867895-Alexandrium_andersonii.AAC.1